MRRTALYSRSEARTGKPDAGHAPAANPALAPDLTSRPLPPRTGQPEAAVAPPALRRGSPARFSQALNHPRSLWTAIGLLTLLLVVTLSLTLRPGPRKLTQDDINAAVRHTLETTALPSPAARAAETVRPSVVRVMGYVKDKRGKEQERGVGTGVVIVDTGIILTNLHVVQGADTLKVVFADGLESTASITGVQSENDLAVLQAHKIPDDLHAATMRSTQNLAPGDQVAAVGFPFGIGPSVSSGVVSGLRRSFTSPDSKQRMTNLIQFDAAANPGNSGGPLVSMDGEVVGIVTAILNPTPARTFIGIGFAVPIENAASAVGLPPF